MATFKPVVRTPRKDGFYKVYIRVVHKIKPGYISTDKLVTKKFIDIFCFTLKIHYLCSMEKKDMIGSVDAMLDEKYGKVGHPKGNNSARRHAPIASVNTTRTQQSNKKEQKKEKPTRHCVLQSGNNSNALSGIVCASASNASSHSYTYSVAAGINLGAF